MTTSPSPQPTDGRLAPFRSLSLVATAVAVSLVMLVALAATSNRSAGASEFYSNPTLSPLNSCTAGEYHYQLGLYNLGANDSTEFTVEITIGEGATQTSVHTLLGGELEWIDTVVPEGVMGTFHVTNDDDPSIDFIAAPRADCVADPVTQISLVCPGDDGPATLLYEWVNTSYTSAHFELLLPDGTAQGGDYSWFEHEQSLEVPVAEDQHVTGSISVDGITSSSIDEVVDCVDESTTTTTLPTPPTTTPPTTTPSTTVPDATVPSTEAPVVLSADGLLAGELPDPAVQVVTPRVAAPSSLAFTGAETGWLAAIGAVLLAAGLVSWSAGRRRRAQTSAS